MEKRICPNCQKPAYSAASSDDWECPYCGKTIPKEKDPSTLPSHTGRIEMIPTMSIPQTSGNIPYPIGIDSYKGTVAGFRLYLLAQRRLLEAGVIVP